MAKQVAVTKQHQAAAHCVIGIKLSPTKGFSLLV